MKQMIAAIALFLFSCSNKTTVPEGILPMPNMTNLLWDVLLADELASQRYLADTVKRLDTSMVLYPQIAKVHGTSQQQFRRSMQFYQSRPDLLQQIIDSLQKRASIPIQAYRRDSLLKE
jgi:hypothetical protein